MEIQNVDYLKETLITERGLVQSFMVMLTVTLAGECALILSNDFNPISIGLLVIGGITVLVLFVIIAVRLEKIYITRWVKLN